MDEPLARNLRVLRAERGIGLQEAEDLTGVTRETIAALERGQRGVYSVTLRKLAEGYGVTLSELLADHTRLVAPKAEGPDPGLVRAAESHASMGARLAEILGPELKEREAAGDVRWLTRVELMLRDYGVVLEEVLGHVTLPDRDTAEVVVAKGMDLNAFYARVEEARSRAK